MLFAFLAGLLFALGLGISGMTQPQNIVAFLDLFGHWDPSLAFVMIGAIAVHSTVYQLWIRKQARPIYDTRFHIPITIKVSPPLIIGAMLFGIGWGLSGFCPGPGIVSLASGDRGSLIFVGSMVTGMALYQVLHGRRR